MIFKEKTALISVDFDYFVREKLEWDWGHNEGWSSSLLQVLWDLRYSTSSVDIFNETDIDTYADFHPKNILTEIMKKNIQVYDDSQFASSESHLSLLEFYRKLGPIDLFINIDAHHDLYGPKPTTSSEEHCGNWWYEIYDNNSDARHVWVYPEWFDTVNNDPYTEKLNRDIEIVTWKDLIIEPHKMIGMFFCRSRNWVPPHLDSIFNEMVGSISQNLEITEREYELYKKYKTFRSN